jgi:UDP-2,3-diacylglucosamine pyrophosphatase LpxH
MVTSMPQSMMQTAGGPMPMIQTAGGPMPIMQTAGGPMPMMAPYGGGFPYNSHMGGHYNPHYLHSQIGVKDDENKKLRNEVFSYKEAIGELEEQVDTMAREGTRFEDILHKGNQDLKTVRERYSQPTPYGGGVTGVETANMGTADPRRTFRSFGDNMDPRKSSFKWGDAETDNHLHNLAMQEQELFRILSNLPENSAAYKTKANKLEKLVRERVELEKMLYNRADFDQYYKEKVIDDQKKDNIAQWLRRDLNLFEKEMTSQKYRAVEGFLVYFDFILNLLKEFKKVQIIYGIYNRGMTVFEPRLVDLTDVNDTTHPNF